jgi:RNA polymerase sigma-70 factor (ECF subfamily)
MEFDQAYKEYFRQIYIFAYRIIGDKNYAMDITQETFVKLHTYMNGFSSLENPKAWLYRVAANISNNHLKRYSTFNRIISDIQKDTQYDNTESIIINREEKILIRKALKKLSSKDRTILQLYQDGFSYAEIAEIMDIKKTVVGKTLSRAIEKCASYIER